MRTTFRADAASAASARRFVADVLLQRGFPDAGIEDAVLLTSEAVAYAVGLGGKRMAIQMVASPGMGRVEVHVLDRMPPAIGSLVPDPPTGPGFLVLQALAEAWGVEPHGPGACCVWFEVRA